MASSAAPHNQSSDIASGDCMLEAGRMAPETFEEFDASDLKIQKKAMRKLKQNLYKKKKKINSKLKTIKNPEKKRILLEGKQKIEEYQNAHRMLRGLKPLYHTSPASAASSKDNTCTSSKGVKVRRELTIEEKKKREGLIDHRVHQRKHAATYSKTKQALGQMQRELAKMDSKLGFKNKKLVFDASDYYFAEQLFGKYKVPTKYQDFTTQGSLVDTLYNNKFSRDIGSEGLNMCRESIDIPHRTTAGNSINYGKLPRNFDCLEDYQSSLSGHTHRGRSPFHYYYRDNEPEHLYKEEPSFTGTDRLPKLSCEERLPQQFKEDSGSFSSRGPTSQHYRDQSPNLSGEKPLCSTYSNKASGSFQTANPQRERPVNIKYRDSLCGSRSDQLNRGTFQDIGQEFQENYQDDQFSNYSFEGIEEEDLRVHLLRRRERKIEERLKMLEQESIETEIRLQEVHEERLNEEVDEFLREQSRYWRREHMQRRNQNVRSFHEDFACHI